jgi:hypothetical protein
MASNFSTQIFYRTDRMPVYTSTAGLHHESSVLLSTATTRTS